MVNAAAVDQWLVAEQLAQIIVSMTAMRDAQSHALAQYNLALTRWRLDMEGADALLESALAELERVFPEDAPELVEPLALTSIAVRKRMGPVRVRYASAEYAIAREKAKRALRLVRQLHGRNGVAHTDLELKVAVEWPSGTDAFRAIHVRGKRLRDTPDGAVLSARATHYFAVSRIRDNKLTGVPELLYEVLEVLDSLETDETQLRLAAHKRLVQTFTLLEQDEAATRHTLAFARLADSQGHQLPAVLIESTARNRGWQPIAEPVLAQVDIDAEGKVRAVDVQAPEGTVPDAVLTQAMAMRFAPPVSEGEGRPSRVFVAIYDDSNRLVDPKLRCYSAQTVKRPPDHVAAMCKHQPFTL